MGTPVLLFHYTQRFYVMQGELDLNQTEKYMIACLVLSQLPLAFIIYPGIMAASPDRNVLNKADLSRCQLLFSGFKVMLFYGLVGSFCLYALMRARNDIYNDQTAELYPVWVWYIWTAFQYTIIAFLAWSVFILPCCCLSCGLKPIAEVFQSLGIAYQEDRQERIQAGDDEV